MRVDKINFYTADKKQNISAAKPQINYTGKDLVVFKGNEDKKAPSFFDKVAKIFKKPELTPEEEKSEEIKYCLGDINQFNKRLKAHGKAYASIAKNLVAIGRYSNYRGYINYDEKEHKKMVFGDIDESTGIPSSLTIVKNGLDFDSSYHFIDGLRMFQVEEYSDSECDMRLTILDKKVIHYEEKNRKTGLVKEFCPTTGGFYYFEGKKDYEGNIVSTDIECRFQYDESKESSYRETDENGNIVEYKYNKQTDMWERTEE